MEDLISRQNLLSNLRRFAPEHFDALVNNLILKEPSVEAVEAVRCKDCVSWDTSWKPVNTIEGAYWCSEHDIYMLADDYCSMAERKEE